MYHCGVREIVGADSVLSESWGNLAAFLECAEVPDKMPTTLSELSGRPLSACHSGRFSDNSVLFYPYIQTGISGKISGIRVLLLTCYRKTDKLQ